MFSITNLQSGVVELKNDSTSSFASIDATYGARVHELELNGKAIIKNVFSFDFKVPFASAIMFPFCGRVKNGSYSFSNKDHKLNVNDESLQSAIHGLVYNKKFTIEEQLTTKESAKVVMVYVSDGNIQGFPFKFKLSITYKLIQGSFLTSVLVENLDEESFPFSIGWHPYFYSANLHNSYLSFASNKQGVFNNGMCLESFKDVKINTPLLIKDTQLDHCYILEDNNVFFKTPDYKIKIDFYNSTFLQVYTPPENSNLIAIEPISSPSNSFNSKIGLQVLDSKSEYATSWKIEMINE